MCAICEFRIEFGVSHPQALTVAVATRGAVESGLLPQRNFDGALGTMRMRTDAMETLAMLQQRLEAVVTLDTLAALPDFYVLLVDSGTWGFFHATPQGFDPDIVPEVPNVLAEDQSARDTVLLASSLVMRALLNQAVELKSVMQKGLISLDARPAHSEAICSALISTFGEDESCQRHDFILSS